MATAAGATVAPQIPVIDPDMIAESIWSMIAMKDGAEVILPAATSR
ncbi:hypothetical protein [Paracoccus laeviglucosivorans]|uniref:Uncharacterized protein n=1 Tax=Paracoccus laeviglucosivorans TaxID=1197861 RepID=A0A521DZE1_9RHOB|nr:hypothetical protein [Paracoccus laeviglucosivorans]SMO76992.1 hypothetical protein SAMN06265221_110113 [Paracoccus laeviglucosivorans]